MVERKHPTRTRRKPQDGLNGTHEPVSAVGKALAKTDTKNIVNKRIPAFTTSRTFGANSPIKDADVNLQAFLARCMSPDHWHDYSDQEKQEIFNSLPTTYLIKQRGGGAEHVAEYVSTEDPPVSQQFCQSDNQLKQAVARFKRDLGDGYYEKAWLTRAKQAHKERLEGKFDEYIKQHTAEMFVDDENEQDDSIEGTDDGSYEAYKKSKKSS